MNLNQRDVKDRGGKKLRNKKTACRENSEESDEAQKEEEVKIRRNKTTYMIKIMG